MLAGVDYVLMGAGIPRTIPGILDSLAHGEAVELSYHVEGAEPDEQYVTPFDPVAFCDGQLPWLERPKFLAIISSATLATMLARKATGYVDGFVVEGPTAGGHNAPPRGALQLNERGEPIYGPRDVPDLPAIADLGRPFWLAGSYGDPQRVRRGARGRRGGRPGGHGLRLLQRVGIGPGDSAAGDGIEPSRPVAMSRPIPWRRPPDSRSRSLELADSISQEDVYQQRHRVCDLGYLRHAYKAADGTIGWRCGAEAVDAYVRKGGDIAGHAGPQVHLQRSGLEHRPGPVSPPGRAREAAGHQRRRRAGGGSIPPDAGRGRLLGRGCGCVSAVRSGNWHGGHPLVHVTRRAADMFERRSLKLPITLGVLMIVSVIALTVGWVLSVDVRGGGQQPLGPTLLDAC